MLPANFLTDIHPLHGEDAAAAIIVTDDARYLLQLRDDIPRIFYPGHWGCFGGALSVGETPLQAIKRELEEELEFNSDVGREFVNFDFDFAPLGQSRIRRTYYEITVRDDQVARFVLHEGAAFRLFAAAEIFALSNVTPYDSFAIWLHVARGRFSPCA